MPPAVAGAMPPAVAGANSQKHEASSAQAAPERPTGSSSSSDKDWPIRNSQRMTIASLLAAAAVLAVLGPFRFCYMESGRAELADSYRKSSHSSPEGQTEGNCHTCKAGENGHSHKAAPLQASGHMVQYLYGGVNGLLMSSCVVIGGIGADLPGHSIFALGSASLVAYSLSTGFGTFLVESTREEFAVGQLREEQSEVRAMPQEEIEEMVCHYRQRGLSEKDATQVADILSKYEAFWIEHMMQEELGVQLPRGHQAVVWSGIAKAASVLVFGTLPLLGLGAAVALGHWWGPQWYRPQFSTWCALGLSAIALTTLGLFLSWLAGSRAPCVNGLLMLVNGCAASLVAFSVSQFCADFGRPKALASAFGKVGGSRDGKEVEGAADSGAAQPSASGQPRRSTSGELSMPLSPSSQQDKATLSMAWPSFRNMFLRGLVMVWVVACTIIVSVQFLERMEYQSMRVFLWGWLTCITTGLGAVPFFFIDAEGIGETPLATANAVAGGMMLAASASMLLEAHEHSGAFDWQLLAGLLIGALFIRLSERLSGSEEEEGEGEDEGEIAALHMAFVERKHFRKAMLIFIVMFCHSAAEGIAVGVAFSKELRAEFGLYVSSLLAVHNVPEGLAVALVLVPRGVSAPLAAFIATLTSVPQPLLALASYLFVDAFRDLLPVGLALAAGAMIYVCLHELLGEAGEQLGWRRAIATTTGSFVAMSGVILFLQSATGSS